MLKRREKEKDILWSKEWGDRERDYGQPIEDVELRLWSSEGRRGRVFVINRVKLENIGCPLRCKD